MIIVASIAVGIVSFIIYALERKSKNEPIVWESAAKLSIFGSLITAGVVFGTSAEIIPESVASSIPATITATTDAVQEMFVGTPTF